MSMMQDMINGLQCSWCETCFEEEHGFQVLCDECFERQSHEDNDFHIYNIPKHTFKEL